MERCTLTFIGVRNWEQLPRLFAWPSDRDHVPCPFAAVYLLARNPLTATVVPSGEVDSAVGACLLPGLLRRVSRQRLAGFITQAPELTWLVDGLRENYGIVAD